MDSNGDGTAEDLLGKASATDRSANTADKFSFWVRADRRVNPFDIVAAEHLDGSETFGLITSIQHTTDAASHLANFISNDFGENLQEPNSPRQGTNVAEAAVLSNTRELYMPVQSEARVRFADEEGIQRALGIDTMQQKERDERRPIRIPAGLIEMSNGQSAVAYVDADYVLGPESAHVNVSGISGLATKTSYITFLIQSALQTLGASDIAVILLNVKYDDLLHIDVPRNIHPEELSMWERLGLRPTPFDKDHVHYILPVGHDTNRSGRPNVFGTPPDAFALYAYSLLDCANRLDLLFSQIDDPADTLGSLIGEIQQGLQSQSGDWRRVQTWTQLLTTRPLMDNGVPLAVGQVRPASVGRFVRLLRRMVKTRQSGIFVDQRSTRVSTIDAEISHLTGGHTYVVDVARLQPGEQTLVFGDVLRTVYEMYSGETVLENEEAQLPKYVIVFVDELNKYAPGAVRGAETPILDQVLDIAERGRSFGIILFSAEQFMSAVHSRVIGNTATKLMGRTDSAEVNEGTYRFLDKDIRNHLTRLNKGELILSHPIYRQPVKIRFPRPPFQQGRIEPGR